MQTSVPASEIIITSCDINADVACGPNKSTSYDHARKRGFRRDRRGEESCICRGDTGGPQPDDELGLVQHLAARRLRVPSHGASGIAAVPWHLGVMLHSSSCEPHSSELLLNTTAVHGDALHANLHPYVQSRVPGRI